MPTGFSNAARLFQVFLERESATHRLNVSHIFRYSSSLPCTSAISVSSSFRGLRLIFLSSHSSLVSHFDAHTFLSFSIRSLRHFCLPCNAFASSLPSLSLLLPLSSACHSAPVRHRPPTKSTLVLHRHLIIIFRTVFHACRRSADRPIKFSAILCLALSQS